MINRARPSSQRAARDFLRRIREIYKLVAAAELGDVWLGGDTDVVLVGHRATRTSRRGQPVPLSNGMYLNVQLALQVAPGSPRLEMTAATFSYQAGPDLDDPRLVFEYHYERDSQSGYPDCHLHVHATSQHYPFGKPFARLHLPTRRLTLEQIVWHLIQEHGVQPRRPDWHEILWRHETCFRDTQRNKAWPYGPPFDLPASESDTANDVNR